MTRRAKVAALQAGLRERPPEDGRRRRSHDSKQRIVDGMLALVAEGHHTPSAEQVSDRAGVGLRTVFRLFKDMESLHEAMAAVLQRRLEKLAREPFTAGDWHGQIFELIERRARIYEAFAPFLEAGRLHRAKSAVLRAHHTTFVDVLRRVLIERLPVAYRRKAAEVEALDLLLSFDTWQRLRGDQNLSVADANAVLRRLMRGLLRTSTA